MKNTILFFTVFIIILGFTSCDKSDLIIGDILDSTMETASAKILGRDDGDCDCCGDWKIEIDGEDQVYMFKQSPNSDIDLEHAEFPLDVTVQWVLNESVCADHVLIGRMELN